VKRTKKELRKYIVYFVCILFLIIPLIIESAVKTKSLALKTRSDAVEIIVPDYIEINKTFLVRVKLKSAFALKMVVIRFEGKEKKIPLLRKSISILSAKLTPGSAGKKVIAVQVTGKNNIKSKWYSRDVFVNKKRFTIISKRILEKKNIVIGKRVTIQPLTGDIESGVRTRVTISLSEAATGNVRFNVITNPANVLGNTAWLCFAGQTGNTFSPQFRSDVDQLVTLTLQSPGWTSNTISFQLLAYEEPEIVGDSGPAGVVTIQPLIGDVESGVRTRVTINLSRPATGNVRFNVITNPAEVLGNTAWLCFSGQTGNTFSPQFSSDVDRQVTLTVQSPGWTSNTISFRLLAYVPPEVVNDSGPAGIVTIQPLPAEIQSGDRASVTLRLSRPATGNIRFIVITNPTEVLGSTVWMCFAGQSENIFSPTFSSAIRQLVSLRVEADGWTSNTVQFTIVPR